MAQATLLMHQAEARLQGFQPVIQLFLYKLSGGLMAPSNTNTSLNP